MNLAELFTAIPSEVSAAAISTIGVVLSALLAFFISKNTVKAEIKKLQITWEHEDKSSYELAFSDMLTATTLYLSDQTDENYKNAIKTLNMVRTKEENGESASTLDMLYYLITDKDKDLIETNLQQAQIQLCKVIEKSREHHR